MHVLKTKEPFWSGIKSGAKNFEVREYRKQKCDDCPGCLGEEDARLCLYPKPARDFNVGDEIMLLENDGGGVVIADGILKRITYVLKDTDFPEGIKPGFCVLGLEDVRPDRACCGPCTVGLTNQWCENCGGQFVFSCDEGEE